jgi:hypothetical protein
MPVIPVLRNLNRRIMSSMKLSYIGRPCLKKNEGNIPNNNCGYF